MSRRTLKYYFVTYGPGIRCGHEHRSQNGVKRCYMHLHLYHPDARIMKNIEVVDWEDLVADYIWQDMEGST
jgi:hypothetical protein